MSQMIALMALGLASGLLIGCIGIGGVILVPALVFIGGIPIQQAIPAALLAYIVSAVVATVIYAREKSIHWNMAAWLCIAAAPAAFAGAWAVKNSDARFLEVLIGVLTTVSGINSLRPAQHVDSAKQLIATPLLLLIGAGTGFTSSLSGTGGPLVLVPILMAFNLPVLTVIGLGQAIQLPIAVDWQPRQLSLWRTGLVSRLRTGTGADDRVLAGSKACAYRAAPSFAANRFGGSHPDRRFHFRQRHRAIARMATALAKNGVRTRKLATRLR